MAERFTDHRTAALALLNGDYDLNRRCGQFLGQLASDATPLSERQAKWLRELLAKAGLPPLVDGGRA